MRRSWHKLTGAVLVLLAFGTLALGCSSRALTYVDSGRSYDSSAALDALARADSSSLSRQSVASGQELRTKALAALTRKGTAASAAASLLAKSFPSDTTGVPVYVERVMFAGKPAVLVVEAVGPEGGVLGHKRLWVVGEDGAILFAGSR